MSIDYIAKRGKGKGVKEDRTVSRLDGLYYALKYVVNVHRWHLVEKCSRHEGGYNTKK